MCGYLIVSTYYFLRLWTLDKQKKELKVCICYRNALKISAFSALLYILILNYLIAMFFSLKQCNALGFVNNYSFVLKKQIENCRSIWN